MSLLNVFCNLKGLFQSFNVLKNILNIIKVNSILQSCKGKHLSDTQIQQTSAQITVVTIHDVFVQL